MHRESKAVCLLLLATLFVVVAHAQSPAGPAPKAPPAKAPVATASATLILPAKLVAGQRATLAVLDAAGRLAPGAAVEFTGGESVTTDETGRAAFTAPAQEGVLLAKVMGRNSSASTIVLQAAANPPDSVEVLDYPRVISITDRFVLDGFGFSGAADGNRVLLGDQPAVVLAASPITLTVLPGPGVTEGPAQLLVEAGGRSPGPAQVSLVSLHLTASKKELAAGEKGTLFVRVRGTDQRLVVEARNLSPDVIEFPKGNAQRLPTSGGAENLAEVEMLGVRPGAFSVIARLVPVAVGLPDVEAARQHLLSARRVAPPQWQERLDRFIRHIERDPQDVPKLRDDLERMLAEKPEGEFGRLIEAAWKELLKH